MIYGAKHDNKINYERTPMGGYAKSFLKTIKDIREEAQMGLFEETKMVYKRKDAYEPLRKFFVENTIDKTKYGADTDAIQEAEDDLNQIFENDRQGINEASAAGDFNPVIGTSFPMHKLILMNNVFENGNIIQKSVADTKAFTVTMETRFLVTPEGEEIDLVKEQYKIRDAVEATLPFTEVELNVATDGQGTMDLVTAIGGGQLDHIAVESYISGIKATVITTPAVVGEGGAITTPAVTEDVWIPVKYTFTAGYGVSDKKYINQPISITHDMCASQNVDAPAVRDILNCTLVQDRLYISTNAGNIKAIKFKARRDASNGLNDSVSVKWKSNDTYVEIGNRPHINIPISPEELKDINSLYKVNQLSKIMSMVHDVMGNHRDDSIKAELDESYINLPKSQKFSDKINFALNGGYQALDPISWRNNIFMDKMETFATDMIQVWNDPNVEISVLGRTDLIRKLSPKAAECSYNAPDQIGQVPLNFTQSVFTYAKRKYNFVSTDKIRSSITEGAWGVSDSDANKALNNLIITLRPVGTNRIMYMVFDYQTYVSNDIRNNQNPTLPAVTAFDRWKFFEYQPVQGRIKVLNPTGFGAEE